MRSISSQFEKTLLLTVHVAEIRDQFPSFWLMHPAGIAKQSFVVWQIDPHRLNNDLSHTWGIRTRDWRKAMHTDRIHYRRSLAHILTRGGNAIGQLMKWCEMLCWGVSWLHEDALCLWNELWPCCIQLWIAGPLHYL